LWIAAGGAIAVVIAGLFMRETAPFKLQQSAAGAGNVSAVAGVS
jgi:hypothetical protein